MRRIKILSVLLCALLLVGNLSAFAYDYPPNYWNINSKYEQALDANNYHRIIEYGTQLMELMEGTPESYQKRNCLITHCYGKVGSAYAEIGDYENSAAMFQKLYDYASRYGDEYYHYVRSAKARLTQYTPQITMYTDRGDYTYYGAANEKHNGVLFGVCASGLTRDKLGNESMVLTYQELGESLLAYNVGVMKNAASDGCAVEFALNCPNEAYDIRNIRNKTSYLKEISDLFAKYSGVPVYLRFGAEFDVWSNPASAEEFKSAFRYVSEYFKSRNKNVAIVWCPNQVSGRDIRTDDYYPGDAYVDWVGVAMYCQKYFGGDKNQNTESAVTFKAGLNSDPVLAVSELVETYGDRKPIMISAAGIGHELVKTGDDLTEFALKRLKEYYLYLPMVYPQIKLIAYFDWYVESNGEKYDYRLSTNSAMQTEFLKLVKGSRFIQDSYNSTTEYNYRPIYHTIPLDSVFEVSCYAHMYDADIQKVTYFIDDKYVGFSSEIPYTTMIDATNYGGRHKLKAVASFDNGKNLVTESVVDIAYTGRPISIEIDGDELCFDRDPIVYNNRTMVPVRKIFEELGAKVTWNADTQTVTGQKGDRTVKLTIGQKTMYVNGRAIALDAAPMVLSSRTLVPARAIAEGLGCTVDWDDRYKVVSITPKVFTWSEWDEDLPNGVNKDLYYIEERDEYRVRSRSKEYYTLDYKKNTSKFVRSETTYGNWSSWSTSYVSSSSEREVQTRTQSSPKKYFYAHYCTGNESDSSIRYKTANYDFSDKAKYHELGWYDNRLDPADNGVGYVIYKSDGKVYRCSNTCYRWYIFDTSGGDYTEYRYRPIYTEYIYWEWDEWSGWSSWREGDPDDYYDWYDESVDTQERTVYRYKEKG